MIHVVLEVSIGPELDVCRNYMASRSGTALVPDLAATDHQHQLPLLTNIICHVTLTVHWLSYRK